MSEAEQQSVYRQLNDDMREGLKRIYQQISEATSGQLLGCDEADHLFNEASDQLREVMEATEKATMSILEVVEKQLERQMEAAELIEALLNGTASSDQRDRLKAINTDLGDDLTNVITTLSFQDITGQRIKKVVEALNRIEGTVVELYVSSGLFLDGAEKNPTKDAQELRDEVNKAVEDFRNSRQTNSHLKGPCSDGCSQGAIDDMLAQLGL